mgnify:CR=1 FL=1
MKRKIFFPIIIILFVLILIVVFLSFKHNEKIYLSNKYYNNGDFIDIDSDQLSKLNNDKYVLFTYNNYCALSIPCDEIFKKFMDKYKIDFLSIPFEEFKETNLYKEVKYAPSIIIVNKNKVMGYLDANSDSDISKYQDVYEFEEWLSKFINFNRL